MWKERIGELHEWSSTEDLDFFKAWFRARYADTIRQGRKGSSNEDFEKIGTSFHTWLKSRLPLVGLQSDAAFETFTEHSFDFYSKLYIRILSAESDSVGGLEPLYLSAWFGIASSLSDPLLMAPINENDPESIRFQKLRIVDHFLDCFTVYRSANQRTLGQSSIRYTLYSLVKEIRGKDIPELKEILATKLEEQEEKLDGVRTFVLNQQNKRFARYFLARLTYYVESECGVNSTIDDYLSDSIKKPAQIEHIWSDTFDRHRDEFEQQHDFHNVRNSFGGLVLLPKGTNQSFNKDEYAKKLPHYLSQNLLAQSLNENCYVKNPNFTKWFQGVGLPLKPHPEFKKADIEERTRLYETIAERIWSPSSLREL